MGCQLLHWNAVVEDQVGQAGPACLKPMLTGPDPLYMPCDDTQDELLHDLPCYQGQAFSTQDPAFNPYWRLVSVFNIQSTDTSLVKQDSW